MTLPHYLARAVLFARNHIVLFVTWGTFLTAGIFAFWLEYRAERQALSVKSFFSFCFPWNEWKSRSSRTDIGLYIFGKFTNHFVGIGAIAFTGVIIYFFANFLDRTLPTLQKSTGTPLIATLFAAALFLATDFSNYITHLMEHKIPVLWEFHKVHHSASFLSPLTTARIHPLEGVLDSFVASILSGLIAGAVRHFYTFSVAELLGLTAAANTIGTILVLDSLRHSQFPVSFGPFDRILLSPHMHHVHHSVKEAHWDKNLGNKLSVFDWVFGTAFKPQRGEKLTYGTGQAKDHQYHSVLACYFLPFLKTWRLFVPSKPKV